MVTGIETAGLVLGTFPIVIEGLKYYINCARKVKEIFRHKDDLRQFMRDIKTEMTIFEDTWYQLTGCDPFQVKAGKLPDSWVPNLPAHLRSNSIDSIETVCEGMKDVLEELQQKFQKYEQKEDGYLKMLRVTFSLSDEYRAYQLALIRRYNVQFRQLVIGTQTATTDSSKPTRSVNVAKSYHKVRENAMILFNVLKEKLLSETCSCQEPHSADLQLQLRVSGVSRDKIEDLGSGSLHRFTFVFPVAVDNTAPEKALPWRELEIEDAEPLLDTSSESFQSPDMEKRDAESHIAVLVEGVAGMAESMGTSILHSIPDWSLNSPATPKEHKIKPQRGLTVSAIMEQFGKMKYWLQDNVEPARPTRNFRSRNTSPMPAVPDIPPSSVTSGPNKVAIALPRGTQRSVATAYKLRKASPSADIISCLCTAIRSAGVLHGCLGVLVSTDNKKHRLWIPERPDYIHLSCSAKAVTLAELLYFPSPSRKERLKLGVKLASSVLQLHKTQWLGERWSKHDIRFIISVETCTSRSPIIENPFLHQYFIPPNTSSTKNSIQLSIVPCNPSLFSLGIVLIELWHWKDLQCLQRSVSTDSSTGWDARTEFFTALQLAKELHDEAGENYGEAVRRCIQGLDTRETNLEQEGFKNKVYAEIVRPLEENLAIFTGKSIPEIFGMSAI
ncbi:hypothetical protein EV426DRAFT_352996 [Tirmania nivea]|nr:hypothetical protein EV426DRAFT_352996 [Tirmania nivea]